MSWAGVGRPRPAKTRSADLTQRLVEELASGTALSLSAHLAGELKELDAVAGTHVGDEAAFGGEDAGDARQRLLAGLETHTVGVDGAGQGGEALWVADPRHLGCEVAPRSRRGEQEGQARADDVGADHHQETGREVARRPGGVRTGPAIRRVDEAAPIRRVLGPAREPPLLPGLPGPGLQPADHRQDAGAPALELAEAVLEGKGRCEEAVHHRGARGLGDWPRGGARARWEAAEELGALRRCRRHRDAGDVGHRHVSTSPKRVSMLSLR
jgi:hypothetical protein